MFFNLSFEEFQKSNPRANDAVWREVARQRWAQIKASPHYHASRPCAECPECPRYVAKPVAEEGTGFR